MKLHKDAERVLISEEQLAEKVKELGAAITADYQGKRPILVCILKGSVVFMADLMRAIDLNVDIDFMVVSSYGSGTKSGDAITGEFKVYQEGRPVFSFDVKDLDLSNLAEGEAKGQLRFSLSGAGASMDSFGLSTTLQISFDIDSDSCYLSQTLYMGAAEMLTVVGRSEKNGGRNISLPESFVTVGEDAALEQWIAGLDQQELLDRLRNAGLEDFLNMIMGSMGDEF